MIIKSDIGYAFRLLAKSPGFTALTTLVMATGIGLSVYLFSFMNTMLFKALPFPDGDTLVEVSKSISGSTNNDELNLHDLQQIREQVKGLNEFGAYRYVSVNVAGRDGARRYAGTMAESNIFDLTRTKPVLGRGFTAKDDLQGAERVVVIGYDVWQLQYNADENVLGQVLRIDGNSHKIIGVMPQGYLFPNNVEIWLPLREDAVNQSRDKVGTANGLAHLEDGYSINDINQQLAAIMKQIETRYPETNSEVGAYIASIPNSTMGDGIAVVYSMHIAGILILILAAVNVGNLLLSRAIERGKETAIRVALGAPRHRIIGQMLLESIIICTVGGIIGLLMVSYGLSVTQTITDNFNSGKPTFWFNFGIDSFTLTIFFSFIIGTIVMTGLVPAWKNSGGDFNAVLRDGTRGALSKKSGRLNRTLVVTEIFLSVGILIAASVIILSSYKANYADYGADTENKLTARLLLPEASYPEDEQRNELFDTLQSRLENDNKVGKVMLASSLPGLFSGTKRVAIEGEEYAGEGNNRFPEVNWVEVKAGTLQKLGVDLLQGRYFSNLDKGLGKKTTIITESFADKHFAGVDPVGRQIRAVDPNNDQLEWLTIVGVVQHTVHGRASTPNGNRPVVFRPHSQDPGTFMFLAMEMLADEQLMVRNLRETLKTIDPELPAYYIQTYETSIHRAIAPLKFVSSVFLLFGIATVVLAGSGIYGVMSNTINQRTQEIGIKRALGAMDERVTQELIKSGAKLLLIGGIPGVLFGGAMGFAMSKVMGLDNSDLLLICGTIIAIIGSVVIFATWLPTKEALKLEPSQALHYE